MPIREGIAEARFMETGRAITKYESPIVEEQEGHLMDITQSSVADGPAWIFTRSSEPEVMLILLLDRLQEPAHTHSARARGTVLDALAGLRLPLFPDHHLADQVPLIQEATRPLRFHTIRLGLRHIQVILAAVVGHL